MLSTKSGTTRYYTWHYEYYMMLRDSTSYYKWYYEILQGITSGSTSHYEKPRVVLGGTTRYYELFYESLCGITRGFRYKEWFFRGILPKIIFQKKCYEQFHKILGKPIVIQSLHRWNYNPMPINLLKKKFHRGCFPMILKNCELWCIANCHERNWIFNSEVYSKPVKHLRWSLIRK